MWNVDRDVDVSSTLIVFQSMKQYAKKCFKRREKNLILKIKESYQMNKRNS
jgi:division protein CdvB (Snf7/Vps24/ESCRT-III family)